MRTTLRAPSIAALLALCALAGGALRAVAQEPDLVTDRPDQTESAVTVPPGRVQIETGWTETTNDAGGIETTVTEAPGTLVRIGLSERLELRLGWAGEVEIETDRGGARRAVDATGDASLGAKLRLRDERGRRPEMAILVGVNLPVGGDEVTSDRADPTVLLSLANTLGERLSLGYNVGLARESGRTAAGRVETETSVPFSAALGIGLAPRVGAFVELFGALAGSSGTEDTLSADAGLTFLLRPNLQLDLAAGVGLDSDADDRFVLAGLSWRLPR